VYYPDATGVSPDSAAAAAAGSAEKAQVSFQRR